MNKYEFHFTIFYSEFSTVEAESLDEAVENLCNELNEPDLDDEVGLEYSLISINGVHVDDLPDEDFA